MLVNARFGSALQHTFLRDGIMTDLGTVGGSESCANKINRNRADRGWLDYVRRTRLRLAGLRGRIQTET
jgi:uncharacterized membrane protein